MIPNKDQILSAIRNILSAFMGFAIAKGWISSDTATNLLALVIPVGIVIWGMFDKTKAATVAKAADIVPIPANVQAQVGIANPQTIPTNPKQ